MTNANRSLFAGMVGLAAGTAAAGCTYVLRRRFGHRDTDRGNERLESEVVDALCADEVAGACPIDVAALGPGLIELSGRVPTPDAGTRAAEVAQGVTGVHTVVNRLTVEQVERQLQTTARRYHEGAPELRAAGWEGMGSGMGARRQGEESNPARGDDAQPLAEEGLGTDGPMT